MIKKQLSLTILYVGSIRKKRMLAKRKQGNNHANYEKSFTYLSPRHDQNSRTT